MAVRFRQGRQSPVNIWRETDGQPDEQVAMATTPENAYQLVRYANAGLQASHPPPICLLEHEHGPDCPRP